MEIDYLQDDRYRQYQFQKLQQPQLVSSFIKFNKYNINKLKKLQQQKLVHLKKKKNPLELKQLVTKAKVDILKKNFVRKLKRGNVHTPIPHNFQIEQQQQGTTLSAKILQFLQSTSGLDLSPLMLCVWSFINIIQISIMVIIFSIQIAFPQTSQKNYFVFARIFSVTLYIVDMTLNFITQRHQIGGHKKNLKQIASYYLINQFTPDFFSIIMFPLSYAFNSDVITPFIMLVALFKLKNNLKRFQSYEYIYVKTNSREQYYGLIKVFLLNFSIGHILSIVLNLMATLNEQHNWYQKVNIAGADWSTKYIWGYYWGANIMLTVGFGDISASNTTQATLLIFIQTLSCITLAYNISCVGSIIGEIKAQNQQKKKKLKYFHRMCSQNNITEELEHKINNFIEQSYLIKQEFQLQEYQQVINSLPKNMQSEYRKQANKSLFKVGFFNSLNNKTVLNLAQFVIRKVAHPQQTIQKKGQIQNFCILQKGCFGFACRNGPKSILNGIIMQKFQIQKSQNPKILSLGFIKRKQLAYDIKSLYYSVYYYLTQEQLMKNLSFCQMDYHFFLFMKDKDENILGSNQIYKCKVCQDDYHTLFQCPKYHYIPMKQIILSNYIKKQQNQKVTQRQTIQRCYRDYRTLYHWKQCTQGQQKYLNQNFDQDQVKQIVNIKKYYYQKNFNQQTSSENILNMLKRKKNQLEQQFQKIQDILIKVTTNICQFWTIQTDQAHNFKYYFKQYNPNRLLQFKTHIGKRKAKDMIFGVYAFKNPNTNKKLSQNYLFNQNQNNQTPDTPTNNRQEEYFTQQID